jgi:hypothetical protein
VFLFSRGPQTSQCGQNSKHAMLKIAPLSTPQVLTKHCPNLWVKILIQEEKKKSK